MHRSGGTRGRFQLDIVFPPPVGRLACSSGATTRREFEARRRMLHRLHEAGHVDVLLTLKRKRYRERLGYLAKLRAADRSGKLEGDTLGADLLLAERLWDTVDAAGVVVRAGAVTRAIAQLGRKATSRDRYHASFAQLARHAGDALPADATVAALATVDWRRVQERTMAAAAAAPRRTRSTGAASWNRLRSAVSAVLTAILGDAHHPFRRAVVKAIPRASERRMPKAITVGQFWTLMHAIEAETPELVPAYVTLAATGMRIAEFLACTEADLHPARLVVHIPDGKTGEDEVYVAEALWPYVARAIPCRVAKVPAEPVPAAQDPRYLRLYRALRKAGTATGITVTPHVLRHLFVQLGVKGTTEADTQRAARHATPDMTRLYAMTEAKQEVAEAVGAALLKRA